jgi:hypothetical protein
LLIETTRRLALIPQEVAGSSRRHPAGFFASRADPALEMAGACGAKRQIPRQDDRPG